MRLRNLVPFVTLVASVNCGARSGLDTFAASIGGTSSVGGVLSVGGAISAGGQGLAPSIGGNLATGGLGPTGGLSSTAGTGAVGCTGSLEMISAGNGLCVAKMVPISSPTTNLDYKIDATEVTRGQYDAWLATSPALPANTDVDCGYVTSYAERSAGFTGADASHHPVADVDWCDAYAYCKAVDKRLCGAIGGGSNPVSAANSPNASQWYRVCSSAGTNSYPYGNAFQSTICAIYADPPKTMAVGAMPNCVTSLPGFAGVYDLSGNVAEWEDSCTSHGRTGYCELRGGSIFNNNDFILACTSSGANITRDNVNANIGFRCCSQ